MEELRCLNCGSHEIEKLGGTYKCRHCGMTFEDDKMEQFSSSVRNIFGEELAAQKEEQIANCRRNLWKASHAENVSSKDVLKWSAELKKLLPDDFMANFYEYACSNNPAHLNEFLDSADIQKNGIYASTIADFLLRGMEYSTVLPLKNLITRSMKGEEYRKYITALEEEAGKIKDGVYSTQVPRDVFVAYSSRDFKAVNEIVEFLESNGISCFVALRNLRHGKGATENYGNALKEAMHNCKCVVFLSSNNSRNLECDALKVELPYIRDHEPQMGRIEYLLEEYTDTGFAAKRICENFFKNLEYCREKEDLVDRVLNYITGFGEEQQKSPAGEFKYCLSCGEKNSAKTKFCTECGSKDFGGSYEDYLRAKLEREYEAKFKQQSEELEKTYGLSAAPDGDNGSAEAGQSKTEPGQSKTGAAKAKNGSTKAKAGQSAPDGLSDEVAEYYEKAMAGDPGAQYELGRRYKFGNGVEKDAKKAFEWFEKSAAQGYVKAQHWLGVCYIDGVGVKKDTKKGIELCKKAAEQGDPEAQYELGSSYYYGDYLPKDVKKAEEWFKKAAGQGYEFASDMLDSLEFDDPKKGSKSAQSNAAPKTGTAQKSTVKEPQKAEVKPETPEKSTGRETPKKSAETKIKADVSAQTGQTAEKMDDEVKAFYDKAVAGDAESQYFLAFSYHSGDGIEQSYEKAFEWYKKAAEQGHAGAQLCLGYCYANADGVAQSDKEAAKWFEKAAGQGLAEAQNEIGVYYLNGDGVKLSEEKAAGWFKKSAEQGFAEGQYNLGNCYYDGAGVEQSDKKAFEWYEKAAEQGLADAQYSLGDCYLNGDGVEQSDGEAVKWFRKAAKLGNGFAKQALEDMDKSLDGEDDEDEELTVTQKRIAAENAQREKERKEAEKKAKEEKEKFRKADAARKAKEEKQGKSDREWLAGDYPTIKNYDKSVFEISGTKLVKYHQPKYTYVAKIPRGVTEIGSFAFGNFCPDIKEVIIPDTVVSIGDHGLYGCSNLKSVTVPSSLMTIGKGAFGCGQLENIFVDSGSNDFSSIDGMLFNKYGDTLHCVPGGRKSIVIPAKTTKISPDALATSNLEYIDVDKDNTMFSSYDGILYGKDGWTIIKVPAGKTKVTIPQRVTGIGDQAFINCSKLKSVEFESLGSSCLKSIGTEAFAHCTSLKSITVPLWVTDVGAKVFYGCNDITVRCRAKKKADGWNKDWDVVKDGNIFSKKRAKVVWDVKF